MPRFGLQVFVWYTPWGTFGSKVFERIGLGLDFRSCQLLVPSSQWLKSEEPRIAVALLFSSSILAGSG